MPRALACSESLEHMTGVIQSAFRLAIDERSSEVAVSAANPQAAGVLRTLTALSQELAARLNSQNRRKPRNGRASVASALAV